MPLTADQLQGLNAALEESNLLGLEVDPERRIAAVTFCVLMLPETGEPPMDRRVQFLFWPLGRVAASLQNGFWFDSHAPILKFGILNLLQVVQSFKGLPIYGQQFFDVPESKNFVRWRDRLSFDYRGNPGGLSHSLDLFQDGGQRHLDVRLWFDELEIRKASYEVIPLDQFIADGQRWWDRFNRGDPRTRRYNIFPLSKAPQQSIKMTHDAPIESSERLIEALVQSLTMRDWDDGTKGEDPVKVRESLMRDIVSIGQASVNPLIELLDHSDWAVRHDAAMMLGHLSDKRAVKPLLRVMLQDDSMSARLSAASALERIGAQDDLAAIREWYRKANVSPQQRVDQKLDEYLNYGETDSELMNRVTNLARRKGATPDQIIMAWWSRSLPPPLDSKYSGGIDFSPEECDYLVNLYDLDDE